LKKRLVPGFMPVRMALGLVLLLGCLVMASHPAFAEEVPQVPVPGMVTMVDLGAKSCIPCKMMEPILAELEKEYEGRAAIVFIDVYKHHEQVERFGLRAIPTQVFFDKSGNEVMRHTGFMDKQSIEAELAKLGVK
jgi:thioredoxin 1